MMSRGLVIGLTLLLMPALAHAQAGSRVVRIDGVVLHADDRVELRITEGVAPLPAQWSGFSVIFQTRAQMQEFVQQQAAQIERIMLAALIYRLVNQAGGVNATFAANAPGKGVIFNVDGTSVGSPIMAGGALP